MPAPLSKWKKGNINGVLATESRMKHKAERRDPIMISVREDRIFDKQFMAKNDERQIDIDSAANKIDIFVDEV